MENPLEFVGLTLYPWKFHTKQSFTPGNSTKSCYTTWLGLFQKKSKQGKSSGYIFLNPSPLPPWNFSFFYFTPGNSRQNKVQPLDIPQNCVKSLGNSKAKNKDSRKFHITFLVTLGNSTLFIINPWKFHMLFLWYPWKLHILNIVKPHPFLFDFFWNSPLEIPRARTKALWKFHMSFFLIIPGNFTPFLIDTWNFHILFFLSTSTPHPLIMFGFVLE